MHSRPAYRTSAGILLIAMLAFGLVWAWESGLAVSVPLSAISESRSADTRSGNRIQGPAEKAHHCHHSTVLFPAQAIVVLLISLPLSNDAFAYARSADLRQPGSRTGRGPPIVTQTPD